MQGKLAGLDGVVVNGACEQKLEESGPRGVGDTPAGDPSSEDVDDHVKIIVGPLAGSHLLQKNRQNQHLRRIPGNRGTTPRSLCTLGIPLTVIY